MRITAPLFEALLKCPTKCHLRALGEDGSGNEYAEWVKAQAEACRVAETERLLADALPVEVVRSPAAHMLKTAKWRLATEVSAQAEPRSSSCSSGRESAPSFLQESQSRLTSAATNLETGLHAVERIPSEGRGKAAQFIPIRFIWRNKLTKDDKLLLAFDAFVLAQALGRDIAVGKIIHGDLRSCARQSAAISQDQADGGRTNLSSETNSSTLSRAQPRVTKVKTSALFGEVRKILDKIAKLLSGPASAQSAAARSTDSQVRESQSNEATRGLSGPRSVPAPDLVLNRHCPECEFHDRCRQKAIETDDLSLLAGMSAKERQKLRSKGIFTVTQLSYTFRPRRRPKRLRDKREKYHHSLKALAIRERKIHIVGSPELKIEGTPVYLDVEGLPDRDFYYLIGLRIGHGDAAVQHSLWADTVADEGKIWREFLALLETVEQPVMIHYGSYETTFLKQMTERHGSPEGESVAARAIASALNLVAVMFAKIYFPTFSNGLKEIGGWLDFTWGEAKASGLHAIVRRNTWETSTVNASRERLISYNAEDCKVLEIVAQAVSRNGDEQSKADNSRQQKDVVSVESLKSLETMWPKFKSPFSEFEHINNAARWDYQRDRVYVRSSRRIRRIVERDRAIRPRLARITRIIHTQQPVCCPFCLGTAIRHLKATARILQDVQFSKCGLRRIGHEYHFAVLWCSNCQKSFGVPAVFWPKSKYGRSLVAYLLYQIIELCIPMNVVGVNLNRLLGFNLTQPIIHNLKRSAARHYQDVQQMILNNLAKGSIVHVDETRVSVKGKTACVWALTNLHEVAYLYTDAREGEFVQTLLKDFRGVLISDFFAAYDSVGCPQQKCLIHLIRDLNTEVLNQPYDQELKEIIKTFAELLKAMIETVDRYGLKKHFLKKHRRYVDRFYRRLNKTVWRSEAAIKCQQRLEKNRDGLFTFLDHDGVPWNNNNAEHAIKAFARLRDVIRGTCTSAAIQEYLVLLSVCQTCKYMGVDFLDFLRSGEKDIHAFAESRRRRRRRTQTDSAGRWPASAISGTGSRPS